MALDIFPEFRGRYIIMAIALCKTQQHQLERSQPIASFFTAIAADGWPTRSPESVIEA
jgi:hypothetical protein